jgi:hypothetical protein
MNPRLHRWPSWFPHPSSWGSAIALLLLTLLAYAASHALIQLLVWLIWFSPRLFYLIWIGTFLSPIPRIAFAHRALHRLLDRYFPDSQVATRNRVQNWLPDLMSWWEGVYGWMVMNLAILVSSYLQDVFFLKRFISLYFTISTRDRLGSDACNAQSYVA